MKKEILIKELRELTIEFLNLSDSEKKSEDKELLFYIINNSVVAMRYVNLIENEYEIEFEDEDVNLSFFESFDHIASLIVNRRVCL